MTRNEELTLLLEIMRKYDLPVSPILEFAIRSKMDDSSGDDLIIPEVSSMESDTGLVQSSEISHIEKPFQYSNVMLEEKTETDYRTRVSDTTRKNRKKTILRVTRPDGSMIEDSKATVTLAITIQEIGVERVRNLNLSLDGMNLILIGENTLYPSQQYYLGDGYYLNTHSSTDRKKYHLEKMFKALGLDWKVEIVSSEW
jgi:ribosomal protein L24